MKQYRIVTDGIRYRVQARVKRWYWQKYRWLFCGVNHPNCGWTIKDYYSLEEAQKGLANAQEEEKAAERGYQPVERAQSPER